MEIERPLIYAQIHRDAIVGCDLHMATVALNVDVLRGNRDVIVIGFLEDGGTNVIWCLTIEPS